MMFLWIFLLVIVAFAIWYIGNKSDLNFPWEKKKDNALGILKKRYAKGEIDEEEYEARKAVLDDEDK